MGEERTVEEVDEEVDSKKKLDQRKKELLRQLRKLDKFTDVPRNVGDVLKEKWQQELEDIEPRRTDLLPEHQKRQKRSQKLQSLQDSKKQCQNNLGKRAEEHKHLRTVIEDAHAKMESSGRTIQLESVAEAELDMDIKGLQAGDEWRGSSASQCNGCCFDTTVFQQFSAMGTENRHCDK